MYQRLQDYLVLTVVNALFLVQAFGAMFSLNYTDDSGFGFYDETQVVAVGGNDGNTLGQQRRNALEKATDILGQYLESDVNIVIEANFQALGGSQNSTILASAGPKLFFTDFDNIPTPDAYYASALANSIANEDLSTITEDISITVNESVDSDPNVLNGNGFYYGFDNNPGDQVNFLGTLLHELTHGLGFISSINPNNGSFIYGNPDSFSLLIKDLKTGKLWKDMTEVERTEAVSNNPKIVFAGPSTEQASLRILKPLRTTALSSDGGGMRLTINNGAATVQSFEGEAPEFGFGVPPWGLTGQLAVVDDGVDDTNDACEGRFVNADAIRGRIAVINRGTCLFVEKVKRAQDAGAIAAVVVNNEGDEILIMGGIDYEITIPAILIGKSDGDQIKAVFPNAIVTLSNHNELTGTQGGLVSLYTPNMVEPGSSLSHWSDDVFPDLLMESKNSNFYSPNLDLTMTALRDIGWKISNIPLPNLTFEIWANETIQGSEKGPGDDPDGDLMFNLMEYALGSNPEDANDVPVALKFTNSTEAQGVYTLEYKIDYEPADIIFDLYKTNDLTTPFNKANSGLDYRQFGRTLDAEGMEAIEIQIESSAEKQFFKIQAELYTE